MDKLKSFVFLLPMLLPVAVCIPIKSSDERSNGVVDEPETSFGNFTDSISRSALEQYVRDLYEEYASESGKLRYGADKPTDVWCFPDKGNACISASSYIIASTYMLHPSPCRCCPGILSSKTREEHKVCIIHTLLFPVEFYGS